MFDFKKKELFYALGKLLDQGLISNERKIVFWGLNHQARLSISYLIGCGIEKENMAIVDNFVSGEFKDITAQSPEQILLPYNEKVIILVATSHNKEIVKQATKYGYRKNHNIFETLNLKARIYKIGHRLRVERPNRYNTILRGWGYRFYKATHKDICQLIEKNEKYKDMYQGERCFIMGNGPSLKQVDFSRLKDEYVFGVNQIMSVAGWENANINFWVCIDENLLGMLDNAQYDFYKKILMLEGRNIEAFVPIEARYYCRYHSLEEVIHINYVNAKEQYTNLDQGMKLKYPNMKQYIMQPFNAVIACINIAIYMGFKEIYLLGCNQTILEDEIKSYLGKQDLNMHAYQENDFSGQLTLNRVKTKGLYHEIWGQLVQLMQFRVLNTFCRKNDIKLINLSSPTLIESIPQMSIEEVLK